MTTLYLVKVSFIDADDGEYTATTAVKTTSSSKVHTLTVDLVKDRFPNAEILGIDIIDPDDFFDLVTESFGN
jgi:hypothetical protein